MHIGLGTATSVDVDVTFLDGTRVIRQGVAANQRIAFNGASNVTPPGAPTNLTSAVVGLSVVLNWTAPAQGPAAFYQVEAGSAPGRATSPCCRRETALGASAPAGTYYVRVSARNAGGFGPPSNEVTVVVGGGGGGCTIPNAPGTLSVLGRRLARESRTGAHRPVVRRRFRMSSKRAR